MSGRWVWVQAQDISYKNISVKWMSKIQLRAYPQKGKRPFRFLPAPAGDRQRIREEVDRQIRGAGSRAFIMGTGSPICDGTDPDTVDYWIGLVRTGA
jgi:hypothetical protein